MIYSSDLRKMYYTQEDVIRLSGLDGVLFTEEDVDDTMEGIGVFAKSYEGLSPGVTFQKEYSRDTVKQFFMARQLYSPGYRPIDYTKKSVESFLEEFNLDADPLTMFGSCNLLELNLNLNILKV